MIKAIVEAATKPLMDKLDLAVTALQTIVAWIEGAQERRENDLEFQQKVLEELAGIKRRLG